MFEFLLGLFITAMLNGIWQNRGDPERHPRYWSKEDNTANVWKEVDSVLFERVYEFDSIRYHTGVCPSNDRTVMPVDSANVQPDSLQLDGL